MTLKRRKIILRSWLSEVDMIFILLTGLLVGGVIGFYFGFQKGKVNDGFSAEEKEMVRQVLSVLTYGGHRED